MYLGQYLYFNVSFNCDRTGTFEAFPPEFEKGSPLKHIIRTTKGTFDWETAKDNGWVKLKVTDTSKGGSRIDVIRVGSLVGGRGLLSTDNSEIESRYVSRIVKHTECAG